MQWNNDLYDQKHGFVSKYGESLMAFLNPKEGEGILDLGCGTGDLSAHLADKGCRVIGIDGAEEMIEAAQKKYPKLHFMRADAINFDIDQKFDAVFSNAVLHWIAAEDQSKVLGSVRQHLKLDGRFVAEMGGAGNVEKIRNTVRQVLIDNGYKKQAETPIWFYPGKDDYQKLLENAGFDVDYIDLFNRPTELEGEKGLANWIRMFGKQWFEGVEEAERDKILTEVEKQLRPQLYKDGRWVADYKRLRFSAKNNK